MKMTDFTGVGSAPTQVSNVTRFQRDRRIEPGCLSDLLQLLGAGPADAGPSPVMVSLRRLHTGETLFHQGAHADTVYFVRAGTFKTFCTAEDGYEQVLGFTGRAEVLGFDAICMGQHPTAAVALEESSVYGLPMRDLLAPSARLPALHRVVTLAVSRALTYQSELADVMAAVAAEVRLARFLVQLSQRMAACGQSPRRFHLRMRRRDIASHLGVAHETVSRSFQALVKWGLLEVANREVGILDMDGLRSLSRSTRRPAEDTGHDLHRPAVAAALGRRLATAAAAA